MYSLSLTTETYLFSHCMPSRIWVEWLSLSRFHAKTTHKHNHTMKRKLLKRLIVSFIALISALVAAEVSVRLIFGNDIDFLKQKQYGVFASLGFKPIPLQDQHPTLFWQPTNFFGLPYDKQRQYVDYRIICLGDSVTQSHDKELKFLPFEQRFPFKLEKKLEKKHPKKMVEVLNGGRGGYTSFQGMRYLQEVVEYYPDLVIAWFGINDFAPAYWYADKNQKMHQDAHDENIYIKSKLFEILNNNVRIREAIKKRIERVSPDDFYANLIEMQRIAHKNNFEIVFIVPFQVDLKKNEIVYKERYLRKMQHLRKEHHAHICNLAECFKDENIKEYFVDTCHPNEKGNEKIAQAVYEFLQKEELIKI